MALFTIKPSDWEYAEITDPSSAPVTEEAEWVKCKHFPTEIHWELLEAGKIPDWNIGRAEHDVQWVSKRTWAFRSVFDLAAVDVKGKKVEIEFESLDTFATVYLVRLSYTFNFNLLGYAPPTTGLRFQPEDVTQADKQNGKEVLKADNHFLTHLVPLPTSSLKERNELLIIFHPPEAIAQAVSDKHGPFFGGSVNLGAKLRMGVRKAQYGFRWDWGPEVRISLFSFLYPHEPYADIIAIDHGP